MRKILFSVMAAAASATSLSGPLVEAYTGNYNLKLLSDIVHVNFGYNFDFGYAVATDSVFVEEDEFGPRIVDNFIQVELNSEANLIFDLNLMGYHLCSFKLNIVPLKVVPLWFSLYHTHPARVAHDGILDLYTEVGYELHLGELQLKRFFSNLLPKVSFMDYIIKTTNFIIPSMPKDIKISSAVPNGWAQERDPAQDAHWKDDPYLKFNILEFILETSNIAFQPAAPYFRINIIGGVPPKGDEEEEDSQPET